jgi:hypothetical protein
MSFTDICFVDEDAATVDVDDSGPTAGRVRSSESPAKSKQSCHPCFQTPPDRFRMLLVPVTRGRSTSKL